MLVLTSYWSIALMIVSYGVISTPEVTDWQSLTDNDRYLVAASDGIFEKMTTQDVCDQLWDGQKRFSVKSDVRHPNIHSLVECIAEAASGKGTVDNMVAIVVPLGSGGTSEFFVKNECYQGGASDLSSFGLLNALDRESGDCLSNCAL